MIETVERLTKERDALAVALHDSIEHAEAIHARLVAESGSACPDWHAAAQGICDRLGSWLTSDPSAQRKAILAHRDAGMKKLGAVEELRRCAEDYQTASPGSLGFSRYQVGTALRERAMELEQEAGNEGKTHIHP